MGCGFDPSARCADDASSDDHPGRTQVAAAGDYCIRLGDPDWCVIGMVPGRLPSVVDDLSRHRQSWYCSLGTGSDLAASSGVVRERLPTAAALPKWVAATELLGQDCVLRKTSREAFTGLTESR